MPLRWKLSFSPFSFLGEGLGMRACESKDASFFFLCFGERRVPFKDKTINRVDVAKPSPLAPSQRERGNSCCIVVDAGLAIFVAVSAGRFADSRR